MKLDFDVPNDGQAHEYCPEYRHETITHHWKGDRKFYYCSTCHREYERRIKIDPSITVFIAEDGEYWHESAGVFVRNPDHKFLFYTRKTFPCIETIPSGHVDAGEDALTAAQRELKEEVKLEGKLLHIIDEAIKEDPCSMGADSHFWHVYVLNVDPIPSIEVEGLEGKNPAWRTLDEALELDNALKKELTAPVRYLIQRHRKLLTT